VKVTDSRLDSIRALVKKIKSEKIEGTSGVEAGAETNQAAGVREAKSSEVSAAGYGELHHAVEERQLANDVQLVLQATDPAREARIESLRAQVASGEYQVSPELVAERLLRSGLFNDEA
jgi:negative regulator of flagellin synthesis FlgM